MATRVQVNINTASREELDVTLGLGPDLADDIINYRELNGPFKSWDDLRNVEGVTDTVILLIMNSGATL
ncbi:MAG: helix-hairpin-helix domain-containing protein [Nitrospirota bacterium]